MAKYYTIRHGQKGSGSGDPPLSALGIKQALTTSQYLKNKPIIAIISSPLLRTFQTAEIIAKPHNLEVKHDPRLRERANWGDLEGQSFADFVKMWNYSNENREDKPEVGDSPYDTGKRLESVIREHYRENNNREFVLVSHAGIIADFLFNIFDGPTLKRVNPEVYKKQNYAMGECSITTVEFNGEKFNLIKAASSKHLEEIDLPPVNPNQN